MVKPWTEFLAPSQVAFMNDIINQVPEEMGARDVFVTCLQQLCDSAVKPKLRYVVVIDGDVVGTNDLEKARALALDECQFVIDTYTNKWLINDDEDDDSEILECQ